jgi:hypothetical protein
MEYQIFIALKHTKYFADVIVQVLMKYLYDEIFNIYAESHNEEILNHIFIGSDNNHFKVALHFNYSIKFLNINKKHLLGYNNIIQQHHVFKYEHNITFYETKRILWFDIAKDYNVNYPEGYFVCNISNDIDKVNQIKIYDVKTAEYKIINPPSRTYDILLTNKYIICDSGTNIIIYNINTAEHIHTFNNTSSWANTDIVLLPDKYGNNPDSRFISINYTTMRIWNTEKRICEYTEKNITNDHASHITNMHSTNDLYNKIVFNVLFENKIIIADINNLSFFKSTLKHISIISCIKSLSATHIIVGNYDGNIEIWNINSKNRESVFNICKHEFIKDIIVLPYFEGNLPEKVPNNKIIISYKKNVNVYKLECNDRWWKLTYEKRLLFENDVIKHISNFSKYIFMTSEGRIFYIFK